MSWICDFCSTQPVTWSYPARSFIAYVVGGIGGESVGSWAACEICHLLIESGDTDALADRAAETLAPTPRNQGAARGTVARDEDPAQVFLRSSGGQSLTCRARDSSPPQ